MPRNLPGFGEMLKLTIFLVLTVACALARPQQDEGSLDDLIDSLFTKSPLENGGGAIVVTPATPGGQVIAPTSPTSPQSQVGVEPGGPFP